MTYKIVTIELDNAAGNVLAIAANVGVTSIVGTSASYNLLRGLVRCRRGSRHDGRDGQKDGKEALHFEWRRCN
jgi:hypothetical protein